MANTTPRNTPKAKCPGCHAYFVKDGKLCKNCEKNQEVAGGQIEGEKETE